MRIVLPTLLILSACTGGRGGACVPALEGAAGDPLALSSLQCWTRVSEPVLRDPLPGGGYEVASDGHVFTDDDGTLRMIYTGDAGDLPSIKLATGTSWRDWSVQGALLDATGPSGLDSHKETSFYRRTAESHQIYYIGYDDEPSYRSQIFVAEADDVEGPYRQAETPVIPRGTQAGHEVYLMTSPSVVEHEERLYMVYLGWNASPSEVSEVWVLGVTSTDGGRTWSEPEEVEVPIGMEGQLTLGPDGMFYAVAAADGITLGRAAHPFGPYEMLADPVLVAAGAPYEVDEANAPQLSFDVETRTAYLYYVGADYQRGWWMMLAEARY